MPKIVYARCERPLIYEIDRLRRIARDEKIDYAIFDSVAFACSGPPESAEIAGAYFRALRQINCGSLHIAHVTKAFEGNDAKPFGSIFWHNGARATWNASLVDDSLDGRKLSLGLFNKKSNLSGLQPAMAYEINFEEGRTWFIRSSPGDNESLAEKMTLKDRMRHILKAGEMDVDDLAARLNIDKSNVYKTVQRQKQTFTLLNGGKVALIHRVAR